jgi:hypothetical protein
MFIYGLLNCRKHLPSPYPQNKNKKSLQFI